MPRVILVGGVAVFAAALGLYFLFGGAGGGVGPDDAMAVQGNPAQAAPGAPIVEVRIPETLSVQAQMGRTIFEAVCAVCHGKNAVGQEGTAPPLVHRIYEPSHHGDAAFTMAARNGVRSHHWNFGNMPPVAQKLTDAEIASVVLYIRTLQRENGIF